MNKFYENISIILNFIFAILLIVVIISYPHQKQFKSAAEAPTPRITSNDIIYTNTSFTIEIPEGTKTRYARFADTGSMLPTFDNGHYALEYEIKNSSQLKVGDIISWSKPSVLNGTIVIHRITAISSDTKGIYYTTKGDNPYSINDPVKVRLEDIKGVVVAIVY